MWRGLFEGWHLPILILVIVIVFGWKRLPDAARSLGRSARILKSEMDEMKSDSAASKDTVNSETVKPAEPTAAETPAPEVQPQAGHPQGYPQRSDRPGSPS